MLVSFLTAGVLKRHSHACMPPCMPAWRGDQQFSQADVQQGHSAAAAGLAAAAADAGLAQGQ
jgi:hypothetical protein